MTKSKFRSAAWLSTAGLVTAALIAPAGAAAAAVTPTEHEGNITTCPEGQGATINLDDENTSGSAAGVTVEIDYDAEAKSLDFTATGGVVWHAFVKGGNGYNHYNYTGLGGVASDTDLVAPNNASGGPAGLSHVVFCVVAAEESEAPSPTPEGSVEAETGTPSTTLPPTDGLTTSSPTGGSWQLLLVAMAGILAAALLLTPAAKKNR
jgi:hypothetical protein